MDEFEAGVVEIKELPKKCPPHEMYSGGDRCNICKVRIVEGAALERLFKVMAGKG